MLLIDEHYPEVLAEFARAVHEALMHKACLQPDVAAAVAFDATERVRVRMGGCMVRIPTGGSWKRTLRDRLILDRFKAGASYRDLAREFELSAVRIRCIVREQRNLALDQKGLVKKE